MLPVWLTNFIVILVCWGLIVDIVHKDTYVWVKVVVIVVSVFVGIYFLAATVYVTG